jgi:hypothetical protein
MTDWKDCDERDEEEDNNETDDDDDDDDDIGDAKEVE